MHALLYGNIQQRLHHLSNQSLSVSMMMMIQLSKVTFLSGSYTLFHGICKVRLASANIRTKDVGTVACVRAKKKLAKK